MDIVGYGTVFHLLDARGCIVPKHNSKFTYKCRRCGNCCRWPGYVRVSQDELAEIANALDMPLDELIRGYTAVTHDRRSLTLVEQPNGHCIFLDENGDCIIYAVRPQQCRDFPNKWNFPGFEKQCNAERIDNHEQ